MKYNSILKKKYTNWDDLELEIEALNTTYERGEIFEQFVYVYLLLNKDKFQLKDVYRSKQIPESFLKKYQLEKKDSGVDGLLVFESGEVAGYQVKFRIGRKAPSYSELAKFWVESKNTDYNYVIANSYYLTKLAQKNNKHMSILVDTFLELDAEFFENMFLVVNERPIRKRKAILKPYPFQERMISDVVNGLEYSDRGKLIAACGTGKTLTSMWISQHLNAKSILFVAPSLSLIKQSLEKWTQNYGSKIDYICVCSDSSVVDPDSDEGDILASDIGVPVTTDSNQLINFFKNEMDDVDTKVIFSTYQSLNVISEAQAKFKDFIFDLGIFDEAHRTAGSKLSNQFSLALHNENVNIKKRLFMTATERLVKPWIRKKAEDNSQVVFSMDDENNYGKILHRFTFGDAIKENVISDYKVVVATVTKDEMSNLLTDNKVVTLTGDTNSYHLTQNLLSQLILAKSFKDLPIKKTISFHSNVSSAKDFVNKDDKEKLFPEMLDICGVKIERDNLYLDHVNGSMSAGQRKQILESFKTSEYGLISNARCLTEGVDVPIIDSVFFVNPKSSVIDIVQACGRALRKSKSDPSKTAYFIVPVVIDSQEAKAINYDSFEMVFNVIQAMRDQDSRLAEWIDKLNEEIVRGSFREYRSRTKDSKLSIILPSNIKFKEFADSLVLKIAEVNKDPLNAVRGKSYGRNERKSNYKRLFRTLGDYSVQSYKDNLVVPTINKFDNPEKLIENSLLKINNNNVSHTYRLGMIDTSKRISNLTEIGKLFWHKKIEFNELFKLQMLKYFEKHVVDGNEYIIFPYRTTIKALIEIGELDYYDFVFGLYSLSIEEKDFNYQAVKRIRELKKHYPHLSSVNLGNREKVLTELNGAFATNFSETDIWEKKTTINNQYIYFRNHLSLFSTVIEVDDRTRKLNIRAGMTRELESTLERNKNIETYRDQTLLRQIYTSA